MWSKQTPGPNQMVVDLTDPNRPRFTMQELKEVLQERNQLKAQLMVAQEELQLFKRWGWTMPSPSAITHLCQRLRFYLSCLQRDSATSWATPGRSGSGDARIHRAQSSQDKWDERGEDHYWETVSMDLVINRIQPSNKLMFSSGMADFSFNRVMWCYFGSSSSC